LKRFVCVLLLGIFLCGCGAEETLETVSDEWLVPAMAQPRKIGLRLPENALVPVLEQDSRQLYMADGYELMLETLDSGDLHATIRHLSGYEMENLTVIRTQQQDTDRYDFVWTAAGEQGERLGRGVILDDGTYHYCLSVLRDTGDTQIVWQDVFGSFSLVSDPGTQ